MSPYREPIVIPERRRIVPKWLTVPVWLALVVGILTGGTIDRSAKPVLRVEVPNGECRDEVQHWSGGCNGTHVCPHPQHVSTHNGWDTLVCTCARPTNGQAK